MGLVELAPGVYAISSLPAAYLEPLDAVVVADLHLGFEEEAASQGYFVPRVQLRRSISILREAFRVTGASRLVVAGDLKHSFSRLLRSEREEVRRLLDFTLNELRVEEVVVVRGNHDNYLKLVLREYAGKVRFLDDWLLERGVLVMHGHRSPEGVEAKVVVMGHEHPTIRLRDSIGTVAKLPCYLVAPYPKLKATLVVLPAVGQYQTGTSVTLDPSTYLSPVLRSEVPLEEAKPYVLAEDLGVLEFPKLGEMRDLLLAAEGPLTP